MHPPKHEFKINDTTYEIAAVARPVPRIIVKCYYSNDLGPGATVTVEFFRDCIQAWEKRDDRMLGDLTTLTQIGGSIEYRYDGNRYDPEKGYSSHVVEEGRYADYTDFEARNKKAASAVKWAFTAIEGLRDQLGLTSAQTEIVRGLNFVPSMTEDRTQISR